MNKTMGNVENFSRERSNLDRFCQKFFSYHMLLEFGGLSFFFLRLLQLATHLQETSLEKRVEMKVWKTIHQHVSHVFHLGTTVYLQILYPMCCVFCNSYYLIKHQICICNHNHIYYIKYVSI